MFEVCWELKLHVSEEENQVLFQGMRQVKENENDVPLSYILIWKRHLVVISRNPLAEKGDNLTSPLKQEIKNIYSYFWNSAFTELIIGLFILYRGLIVLIPLTMTGYKFKAIVNVLWYLPVVGIEPWTVWRFRYIYIYIYIYIYYVYL